MEEGRQAGHRNRSRRCRQPGAPRGPHRVRLLRVRRRLPDQGGLGGAPHEPQAGGPREEIR
eukprot:7569073-Lingulodinium_polyedra.AAC.1